MYVQINQRVIWIVASVKTLSVPPHFTSLQRSVAFPLSAQDNKQELQKNRLCFSFFCAEQSLQGWAAFLHVCPCGDQKKKHPRGQDPDPCQKRLSL